MPYRTAYAMGTFLFGCNSYISLGPGMQTTDPVAMSWLIFQLDKASL
jgi:hypothetical protein